MKTVHILGDSIARGYALGTFSDLLTGSEPLFAFRSIWSAANDILTENKVDARVVYGAVPSLFEPVSPSWVRAYVRGPHVREGDVVILEDAGQHNSDPAAYRAGVEACLAAAVFPGVTIAVMNTYDAAAPALAGAAAPLPPYLTVAANMQFSSPMGDATINQAIAEAAATYNVPLIDICEKLTTWRYNAFHLDGVDVMLRDGVHPNIWGQFRIMGALLHFAGLGASLVTCNAARALASANYIALGYGTTSPTWNADRAADYVSYCVTTP